MYQVIIILLYSLFPDDLSSYKLLKILRNLDYYWFLRTFEQGDWRTTFILAFQSIGVVYGDIGTSPLYVYASTFTEGIHNADDILGVLSLIIYTIVLVPLLKYVFIVLLANDNGDGK